MSQSILDKPLNHHQLEILKLFSREMEEKDLVAIKKLITKYLADKVTNMLDKVWEDKGWTDKDMLDLLNNHKRTKYNPEN